MSVVVPNFNDYVDEETERLQALRGEAPPRGSIYNHVL